MEVLGRGDLDRTGEMNHRQPVAEMLDHRLVMADEAV
jgi:hypothetical protein